MSENFNGDLHDALIEACKHIEWLTRYVKVAESGDAFGAVENAKTFLNREDVYAIRRAHAQLELAQELAAQRRRK